VRFRSRFALLLASGVAAGGAIGSCAQETGSCIPGTPGCICTMAGNCDPGLVCVDNRCVSPDEDPVADGSSSGFRTDDTGDVDTSSSTTFVEATPCEGASLRLVAYNVQGLGSIGSEGWDALGSTLRRIDADLVCIEEFEDGDTEALRALAEALGYGEPIQAAESPGIGGELRNACLGRLPATRIESFTATDLSSDPDANDVGRDFLAVRAEAGPGCHVSVLAIHAKSGLEPIDLFRRQVEFERLGQAIARVRAEHPDDALVVMGDFNENIDDPVVGTTIDALPTGLPPSYQLGDDIVLPLHYDPFAKLQSSDLAMVDATHEDSEVRGTWSAFDDWEGVRLDYVFLDTPDRIALAGALVYNTCLDDGTDAPPTGSWLPMAGEPVPCWVGPAASDHLPLVVDLQLLPHAG